MSDAKHGVRHTPGPWMAHQRSSAPIEYGHYVTTIDGLTVCNVSYQLPVKIDGQAVEETRIANARLIAAAPELLEALLYYRDECSGEEPSISVFQQMLERAISRATGDSDEQ
ncbi:MAG: hypothetical protein J0H69_17125 [Burkholderiales bacterium]|nr:hypothetical protein [Burkholderiales bacterium]